MVCGVTVVADTDYPYHPNLPYPAVPKPRQSAPHYDQRHDLPFWHLAAVFTVELVAGPDSSATDVLADRHGDASGLHESHALHEDLVPQVVWLELAHIDAVR